MRLTSLHSSVGTLVNHSKYLSPLVKQAQPLVLLNCPSDRTRRDVTPITWLTLKAGTSFPKRGDKESEPHW